MEGAEEQTANTLLSPRVICVAQYILHERFNACSAAINLGLPSIDALVICNGHRVVKQILAEKYVQERTLDRDPSIVAVSGKYRWKRFVLHCVHF
jgi:hypothetical protein